MTRFLISIFPDFPPGSWSPPGPGVLNSYRNHTYLKQDYAHFLVRHLLVPIFGSPPAESNSKPLEFPVTKSFLVFVTFSNRFKTKLYQMFFPTCLSSNFRVPPAWMIEWHVMGEWHVMSEWHVKSEWHVISVEGV